MSPDRTDQERIAPYVSNLDRDVFSIYGLPEEVIAVLFAYYSRSRDNLRDNLARLLRDEELAVTTGQNSGLPALQFAAKKAHDFHEKWVVGYGHSSVAEHAVIHLALENISIVASKVIEDLRLGSYTEKSTRYVVFDTASFIDLPELPAELHALYRSTNEALFRTYLSLFEKVEHELRVRIPKGEKQTPRGYESALRSKACDLLRGLLPAGTKTNLGLTANARALEGLLTKMLSSPLAEANHLAEAMLQESLSIAPTLVKYAAPSPYRKTLSTDIEQAMQPLSVARSTKTTRTATPPAVRLVRSDTDALMRIALGLTYDIPDYHVAQRLLEKEPHHSDQINSDSLVTLVRASVQNRGRWDAPPRAFELTHLVFELTLDYGAYRDMQRHRLLTPITQSLGCKLGCDVPDDLEQLGVLAPYTQALEQAERAWERLVSYNPLSAQYVVPLAYRIRVLWSCNLRELFHIVELRSSKQGHSSYRRIAQELYRVALGVHPWLEGLMRVDLKEYSLARD